MKKILSPLLALLGGLAATSAPAETGEWPGPARQAESGPNPGMAFALSVAGTAAPLYLAYEISEASDRNSNQTLISGLFMGGILLGPSTGQFYAGSWGRGLAGAGVRTLGLLILRTGLVSAWDNVDCQSGSGGDPDCEEGNEDDGAGAIVFGTLLCLGGTVYSAIDAILAPERWHRERESNLQWAPALQLARDGSWQTGLLTRIRF